MRMHDTLAIGYGDGWRMSDDGPWVFGAGVTKRAIPFGGAITVAKHIEIGRAHV